MQSRSMASRLGPEAAKHPTALRCHLFGGGYGLLFEWNEWKLCLVYTTCNRTSCLPISSTLYSAILCPNILKDAFGAMKVFCGQIQMSVDVLLGEQWPSHRHPRLDGGRLSNSWAMNMGFWEVCSCLVVFFGSSYTSLMIILCALGRKFGRSISSGKVHYCSQPSQFVE